MTLTVLLAHQAVVIALLMVAGWLVTIPLKNVGLIDVLWAPGFAVLAGVSLYVGNGWAPRSALLLVLTGLWALRLGGYLGWRNIGKPEDRRYAEFRRYFAPGYWWKSLFQAFGLQGTLMLVVGAPITAAALAPSPAAWTLLDGAGVLVFAAGFFFEAVGDWQLVRFKADPASAGQVLERGLWRYSRHPNYFGNFLIWWGIGLVGLSTGAAGAAALLGPAIMTGLLLKVSGVALLEKDIGDRRPAYADYIARTNAFFPGPPRG